MQPLPILIVGAGPAGLSASIQARRDLIDHVVVGREPPGGLVPAAWRIDNLAGFPGGVAGTALARRLERQAQALDLPVETGEVVTVSRDAGAFAARLASGREIVSLTLVLATGTRPRPWHVGGCEDLPVHRDVRTLPADLDDRTVAIVGGGDAALDSALSVHSRGGTPVVLVRGGSVAANARIARRVEERSIEVRPGCAVDAVSRRGDRILVAGLEADHLLVCIGREPDDVLYRMLVPDGPLPPTVETHVPGLFVAGDIIAGHERFVALAQGNGQRAALLASRQGR